MSQLQPLFPRQPVPSLTVPTLAGGTWTLAEQTPETFSLVVFYRGFHCPVCAKYLRDLDSKVEALKDQGVVTIVVSSDTRLRAEQAQDSWKLANLTIAYDLTLDKAREWGLYISRSIGTTSSGVEEPELFSEPGLFLIKPDGTLYFGTVQTMPFARPRFADILSAIDYVLKRDYPARGEVVNHKLMVGS